MAQVTNLKTINVLLYTHKTMKTNVLDTLMFLSNHAFRLFFIQVLAMQLLMANTGTSQKLENTTVTLQLQEATLEEVFEILESRTDFIFAYNQEIIQHKDRISLSFENRSLRKILEHIGKNAGLQFKLINKTISVKPVRSVKKLLEDGIIVGVVRDGSGNPLPFALVRFKDGLKGTTTDPKGRFRLSAPQGSLSLEVSYIGYEKVEVEVEVAASRETEVNVVLNESSTQLDQIVVYGNLTRGQAKALQEQRNSGNIKNVVDREKFGQYPDQAAAETLQRLPGVSITRDQGEGEMVQVRGVSEQFNTLTINGERMPTVEDDANGRSFGLDAFQSYLVDKITLTKALTADMDADAIGGTVNFQLREAGDDPELNIFAAGGLNTQESEFEDYGRSITNLAGMGSKRFLDDKLGILVAGSYYNTDRGSIFNSWRYERPDPDEGVQDGMETNTPRRRRTTDYDVTRERIGMVGNLDFRPNVNNKLTFTYNYTGYNDEEIRRQARYTFSSNNEQRRIRNRREEQVLNYYKLTGEHQIRSLKVSYGAAYITGEETTPDRVEFRFSRSNPQLSTLTRAEQENLSANTSFGLEPLAFSEAIIDTYLNEEDHMIGQIDFELPVVKNSQLKFGAKWRNLQREARQDRVGGVELTTNSPNVTNPDGGFALEGIGYDDAGYAELNLSAGPTDLDLSSGGPDSYEAEENIYASYIMNTTQWTEKFSTVAGIRFEQTDQKYSLLDTAFTQGNDYLDILPSVHLKYELINNLFLRTSWSTGISRPNYNNLVPVTTITGLEEQAIGNPDLEATRANNFDLMAEWYTPNLGFFSIGLFGKFISDPVVNRSTEIEGPGGEAVTVTIPENGGSARVLGIEVSASQKLSVLDVPWLKYVGVDFNYTFADSEADFGTAEDDFPLVRSPRHTGNLSLSYDNPKGLFVVVAGNFRDFVFEKFETSSQNGQDIWLGSTFHLDATLGYQFTDFLRAKLQVNNLTNQPNEEIVLEPTEQFSRIHEREAYNVWGSFGLELNLR